MRRLETPLRQHNSDTPNVRAARHALATYDYDARGQLETLDYHWQNGSTVTAIRRVAYDYNPNQFFLRSEMRQHAPAGGSAFASAPMYKEQYAYHPTLDYLTSASYFDNGSELTKTDTWTYDVAGNRTDTGMAFDHLNRITTSQGFNYIHDAVGNRLAKRIGTQVKNGYTWDSSNRLRSYTDQNTNQGNVNLMGTGGANYAYLPNGLRCTKVWDAALEAEEISEGEPILSSFYDSNTLMNDTTTRYRYDGQMTLEEDVTFTQGENTYVDQTSYLLGGRGIEMITARRMDGPTPAGLDLPPSSFPIYDGHGNMIATLAKNGTSFTLANEKKYDVWGGVRSASGAGTHIVNPNKQYCANLGHTWDGESGLIYMRARYYEPSTGRFISEDPILDGVNWYVYAESNPVAKTDPTGLATLPEVLDRIDDELNRQIQNAQMGRIAHGHATKKIHEAIYKWAEEALNALGDDAWQVFHGRSGETLIGIHNKFRIQIHLTDDLMKPHALPHLQVSHVNGFRDWAFWCAKEYRWIYTRNPRGF